MFISHPQHSLLPFLILGVIQGVALWLSFEFWPTDQTLRMVTAASLGFLLPATFSLQLSLRDGWTQSKVLLSLLLGCLFAGLAAWMKVQSTESYNRGVLDLWFVWWPSFVFLACILIPFFQSWTTSDALVFRTAVLYLHSWD